MVYQILCQAHLKQVGLTQNREIMTIQTLKTIIYYNMYCGRPR